MGSPTVSQPPARTPGPAPIRRIRLMGMPLDVASEERVLDEVFVALRGRRGGWIVTANLDHLRRFVIRPGLHRLYEDATLVVADGMPLVWAARLLGFDLRGRVAGSSLIEPIARRAAAEGRSIYLFGGERGAAVRAAEKLQAESPALRIAGTVCPEFGFEYDPERLAGLMREVAGTEPDIVLVCLGSPKQEHFIELLREHLPDAWCMGVGVSLSFISGALPRAPEWMQRAGLEWLHRLGCEPRRLFERYVVHGIPFALRLGVHVVRRRVGLHPDREPWKAPRP